jgi:NADH-quinone oxidoreductase subunit N
MEPVTADFFKQLAETNRWSAILPEIFLACIALSLLAIEMLSAKKAGHWIVRTTLVGLILPLAYLLMSFNCTACSADGALFSGLLIQTDFSTIMRCFFLVSALLVTYLGARYLEGSGLAKTEFFVLVLIIALAMMLLVQSHHFVMFFVALETVTIAFYVLVAYCRTRVLSLEAGLKYLVMGALSSSILLFGIVLLYGVAGNAALAGASPDALNFSELKQFIELNADNLLVQLGVLMVLAGICFKIGAVPFQIWVPDVYQGAPLPVTAYLAVASKAAGFAVLLQLVVGPFAGMSDILVPVLSVIAIVSILFGNIAAVTQSQVKRVLGFSGIAHAGYLLVGVVAAFYVPWAIYAVLFYLCTYLVASFSVMNVLGFLGREETLSYEDFKQFSRKNPFLCTLLTCGLGSLAGIPPLGGFIAKLFLFIAAYQADLYLLLLVSIIGVVISIYYYFSWIRVCLFSEYASDALHDNNAISLRRRDYCVLGSLLFASFLLGLYPGVLPIVP